MAATSVRHATPAHSERRWFLIVFLCGPGMIRADIVRRSVWPEQDSSDNNRMSRASTPAQIECTSAPPSSVEADVLIVPWFEGDTPSAVPGLDPATGGDVTRALESK